MLRHPSGYFAQEMRKKGIVVPQSAVEAFQKLDLRHLAVDRPADEGGSRVSNLEARMLDTFGPARASNRRHEEGYEQDEDEDEDEDELTVGVQQEEKLHRG